MGSPTMGAWECRHGVDGRDDCPECFPPTAPSPAWLTEHTAVEWLPASLAEAVLSTGRAQILLARDAGLSEKHVSQMLTGKVAGSFEAWHALLDAAGVRIAITAALAAEAEKGGAS